jgi:competence protein ComEA
MRPSVARVPGIEGPRLALYVAAAIAIAVIGARYLRATAPPATPPAVATSTTGPHATGRVRVREPGDGWVVVQVAGAVRRPGVYRLHGGARANDAVRRAGGALRSADLTGVNLAAKLEDGRQVIVPSRAPAAAPADQGAGSAATAPAGGPLNLNTATAEQLDALDGVGPATAAKILAYRQQHGGFRSVDELGQVPGIGDKKLAALRPLVSA